MGESEVAAPEENCEYKVVLGRSLFPDTGATEGSTALEDDHADAAHVLFQYQFTPASVDTATPGLVSIDDSTGATVLRGTTATAADGGINFKGKVAEQKDTECLLIFDGASFRLERCDYVMSQLRHVRAAPLQRPPPSAYPAPISKKNIRLGLAMRTGKPIRKGPKKAAAKSTSDATSDHTSAGIWSPTGEKKSMCIETTTNTRDIATERAVGVDTVVAAADKETTGSPSSKRRRLDAMPSAAPPSL